MKEEISGHHKKRNNMVKGRNMNQHDKISPLEFYKWCKNTLHSLMLLAMHIEGVLKAIILSMEKIKGYKK